MGRLMREVIVTEKIDGTNACIYIGADGEFLTGSRTRWITPEDDNFGFAAWAQEHKAELMQLGPGRHFGEWWGKGIQRGYGLAGRRFSLFNTIRWCLHGQTPQRIETGDPRQVKMQDVLPPCVGLVPVLWQGPFAAMMTALGVIEMTLTHGSYAAPGFRPAEGVVVYHTTGNVGFKMTFDGDGHKGAKRNG